VVNDFTSDPHGIASELRAEAGAKGFIVALSNSDIPPNDVIKMCVMSGSWSANGLGEGLTMRVVDASGFVAEASARATAWVNANRTVRAAVSKIYSQLRYTGFNEDVYQQDDPRTLQISAQVQPGSSGSPLFDADGNIVGIVVATLVDLTLEFVLRWIA
jgi:hypothetical protein